MGKAWDFCRILPAVVNTVNIRVRVKTRVRIKFRGEIPDKLSTNSRQISTVVPSLACSYFRATRMCTSKQIPYSTHYDRDMQSP